MPTVLGAFFNETLRVRYCYPSGKLGKVLIGWRVAEHLQSVKGMEVLVTSWGVEYKEN